METDILAKLDEQERKLNEIYTSVEKMRKYFLWTLIITLAFLVLPIIGLLFAIPKFLSTFTAPGLY